MRCRECQGGAFHEVGAHVVDAGAVLQAVGAALGPHVQRGGEGDAAVRRRAVHVLLRPPRDAARRQTRSTVFNVPAGEFSLAHLLG